MVAQVTAVLGKQMQTPLASKVKMAKLVCSLAISIFLYASGSFTLIAELEKRTQTFEKRCYLGNDVTIDVIRTCANELTTEVS